MDGYDPAYVAHNVPYLVISGLGVQEREQIRKDGGARIVSEIPIVESEDARTLLQHFMDNDASALAWNGKEHTGRNKFKIKAVGRVAFTSWHYLYKVTEDQIGIYSASTTCFTSCCYCWRHSGRTPDPSFCIVAAKSWVSCVS